MRLESAEAGEGVRRSPSATDEQMTVCKAATRRLRELGVDDVRVLLPLVLFDPHLRRVSFASVGRSMTAVSPS
jgi:hypothetical protein